MDSSVFLLMEMEQSFFLLIEIETIFLPTDGSFSTALRPSSASYQDRHCGKERKHLPHPPENRLLKAQPPGSFRTGRNGDADPVVLPCGGHLHGSSVCYSRLGERRAEPITGIGKFGQRQRLFFVRSVLYEKKQTRPPLFQELRPTGGV